MAIKIVKPGKTPAHSDSDAPTVVVSGKQIS